MSLGERLRDFIDPFEDEAYEDDVDLEPQEPWAGVEQSGRQEPRLRAVGEDRQHQRERNFFLIAPREFEDVQQIADRLKAGTPVIIDYGSCGAELSRRLLDFASGLSYALDARLEFVGERVVLLAPPGFELSGGIAGTGPHFFNQC